MSEKEYVTNIEVVKGLGLSLNSSKPVEGLGPRMTTPHFPSMTVGLTPAEQLHRAFHSEECAQTNGEQ